VVSRRARQQERTESILAYGGTEPETRKAFAVQDAQNATPKEERVKQIAVFVCLVLCLAASAASAQAIRNPGFTNLNYWNIYYEGTNWSTPGAVTWEGTGSVRLKASGGPGTIGMAQPTCEELHKGDTAWVDLRVVSSFGATFSLVLGDGFWLGGGQRAELVDPSPGSYHLSIVADRKYPQGTWYSFRILAWPGPMEVVVSHADASPKGHRLQGAQN
jgi:hypothetical protein